MKQVFIFHGGNSFNSYESYLADLEQSPVNYERLFYTARWSREGVSTALASTHDVLIPSMPNTQNAQYEEWKICFEKLIPFFSDDVQLVGHSLGAMFLAKYLNATPLPTKVRRLVLVAGGYSDDSNEELGSFAVSSTTHLPGSADEIHLFHSTDDFVVPYGELTKFQTDLPNAHSHVFDDRGHFLQPDFPELYDLLKQK